MRLHTFIAFLVTAPLAAAQGDCDEVWNTGWTNYTLGASDITSAEDREVADDFDYTGALGRMFFEGNGPLNGSYAVDGVWVRFYAWTSSGPGALQHQRFIAGGDPNLGVSSIPETIDITLAPPFVASGKHFVSVQVDFAPSGGYWWPWTGGSATPQLSHAWVRDNLAGGAWTPHSDITGSMLRDMSFTLQSAPSGGGCAEWQAIPTPAPNPEYSILRDIDVISANDVWAVGHYEDNTLGNYEQVTLTMHFDGTQWVFVPAPSPAPAAGMQNSHLWAVDGSSANDVWAGGEQNMVVPGGWVGSQPFALHWDGIGWSEVPTPLPPTSIGAGYTGSSIQEIEAIATNDVWFLGRWVGPYPGTTSTRPAMAMHWDGSSIQLVPTPVVAGQQTLSDADSSGPNDVWAVGSMSSPSTQYPYVVRWNGSTWSHVLVPPAGVTTDVVDVDVVSPNEVWISAQRLVGTQPQPFLLKFNGTSWSQIAAPAIADMVVNSANDIWLATWQIHHWDGAQWSVSDGFSCVPSPAFANIAGSGTNLWAAGRQIGAGLVPLTVRYNGLACSVFAYCTSSSTTNGCAPHIAAIGSPSASATSGFTLRVDGVEGQKQGLLFYGISGQQASPWATGSSSFLCVKTPTQRMNAQSSGGNLFQCDGVLQQDWHAFMAANPGALGNPRTAGATFDAQGWFRDPAAPKTTNLSDALEFVLVP